jgi:branched-chain amino acid transport system permease protein
MTSLSLAAPAGAEEAEGDSGNLSSNLAISGTLIANGVRLEGVEVQVVGGGVDVVITSDAQGKWTTPVPSRADYKILLDTTTLPDGVALVDPAKTELEVKESDWLTSNATRNFQFVGDAVQTASLADQILQRIVAGLIFGSLLALASVGLSLIFGTTGLSNFAHGEAVTLGGITAWITGSIMGLPFPAVVILGLLVGGLSVYLQNEGLWKPLRKRGN